MVYALDTNCLVRWLLWDNQAHAQRVDDILQASAKPVHVADLAIIEMAWVLKSVYKFNDETIAQFISMIIEHKNINCNKILFRQLIPHLEDTPKVSLTDICLVQYSQLSGAHKLISFDKTLAKRFPKLVGC